MTQKVHVHNTGTVSQASRSSLVGTLHMALYIHAAYWSNRPCAQTVSQATPTDEIFVPAVAIFLTGQG